MKTGLLVIGAIALWAHFKAPMTESPRQEQPVKSQSAEKSQSTTDHMALRKAFYDDCMAKPQKPRIFISKETYCRGVTAD